MKFKFHALRARADRVFETQVKVVVRWQVRSHDHEPRFAG
jgi:hypothetical protein